MKNNIDMNLANEPPPVLMIVDDSSSICRFLESMLSKHGYRVRTFSGGRAALKAAAEQPPDLIMLDINMPEMTGYEVCAELKASPRLKDVPVIFISTLKEASDQVKAFAVGAVDYVRKPFRFEEIEARIRTHLELRRKERELQGNYERLRNLEKLRDDLTHMMVHDMRSPLSVILLTLEMVRERVLPQNGEVLQMLKSAHDCAATLKEMITQLLDIHRLEAGQMPLVKTPCNLAQTAKEVLDSLAALVEKRKLLLISPEPVIAYCDTEMVRRVLGNLLGNALKFTAPDGKVKISITHEITAARVAITDNGPGIPQEQHQKIFEKFCQVEGGPQKYGTGLGLTFCKLAVEAHGGRIGVESQVGKGSKFWLTLPFAS